MKNIKVFSVIAILCVVLLTGCGGPSGKYYRYNSDKDTYDETDFFEFSGSDLIYTDNGSSYICEYKESGNLIGVKLDYPGNPLDMTFEYDSDSESLSTKYDVFKKKDLKNNKSADEIKDDVENHYVGELKIEDELGNIIITNANIKKAKANTIKDASGNEEYIVELTLDQPGTSTFAEATGRASKTQGSFKFYVDGNLVGNPTVQTIIADGITLITGFPSLKDAKECAKAIEKY